jgi:hypothetical protein
MISYKFVCTDEQQMRVRAMKRRSYPNSVLNAQR